MKKFEKGDIAVSNYTEAEIMLKAAKVIEESGSITTTELIEVLVIEMKPSGDDLLINKNRNDTKFSQKVRNMVSHRETNRLHDFCTYKKVGKTGLLISKTIDVSLTEEEREKRGKQRLENRRKFLARKIDFEEQNRRNKEIGDMGEDFVFILEKANLSAELAEKVRHISKEDGDGAGYDILSYTSDNLIRFLEVKTTTGGKDTPFYLSENERLFLEANADELEIIRVYHFNVETKTGEVERISGRDFLNRFLLTPLNYKATLKSD